MVEREALGPAEVILNSLLNYQDHMVHNRPGVVTDDARYTTGVRWHPVTHKVEGDDKVVYRLDRMGRGTRRTRIGVLRDNGDIYDGRRKIGRYQPAGLFGEVVVSMYKQVADVWKLDNEFAARWASYAYKQDHRDLKVVLAAFMLVQARKGDPIKDEEGTFFDDDYRDVGEAMMLLYEKGKDLNPKMLLRVHDVLSHPEVAQINRDLGFGKSTRSPFYGRWSKAVQKWLRYREENPQLLEGLVKAGFRTTVMELARRSRYKPETTKFFETLGWKQKQADDGHREMLDGEFSKAESWEGMTEEQICERIVETRPNWKRIVGLLPKEIGVTRAIAAAAIEAGSVSDKDLIILTPTLEALGLLEVQEIRERHAAALAKAEDLRAANIARNVRSQKVKDALQEAADTAMKAAVEEVSRDMRIYFMIDVSGSMTDSIPRAKQYISQFMQGFPLDRFHVCIFNSSAREIEIKRATKAGVDQAFTGIRAGGGTDYTSAVRLMAKQHPPKEGEDVLFFFIGDEEDSHNLAGAVRRSGLNPVGFAFLKVEGGLYFRGDGACVRNAAAELGVPCFMVEEDTFSDPYAIPRTIRNLIAATPVGEMSHRATRVSLVDTILQTELLKKPAWAA